jgi:hypothetical protein
VDDKPSPTGFSINNWGQVLGHVRFCTETWGPEDDHCLESKIEMRPFIWLPASAYGLDCGVEILDSPYQHVVPALTGKVGDINDAGQIVISMETGTTRAVLYYDLNDDLEHLKELEALPLWNLQASSLNNLDPPTIVGYGSTLLNGVHGIRAFRKTLGETAQVLSVVLPIELEPHQYSVRAYSVADTEMIAGEWRRGSAFVSEEDPEFFPGCQHGSTPCPNEVEYVCNSPGRWEGEFSAYMAMLPVYENPVHTVQATPLAINNANQMVGKGAIPDVNPPEASCPDWALFWQYDDVHATALPQLAGEFDREMEAYDLTDPDVNGHLWVVGQDLFEERAVLWRGIYDAGTDSYTWLDAYNLNDLIDETCTDSQVLDYLLHPQNGQPLLSAVAINNAGWIVAHSGRHVNNTIRTFVLIPTSLGCDGDLNGDGVVDVSDLLILLSSWGACASTGVNCVDVCPADLNCDGVVDISDLLVVLSNWGACPGLPDPGHVSTLEEVVTGAGLTMNDWSDFVNVMMGTDEQAKENWNCWMQHYLFPCTICSSICSGTNPFH